MQDIWQRYLVAKNSQRTKNEKSLKSRSKYTILNTLLKFNPKTLCMIYNRCIFERVCNIRTM